MKTALELEAQWCTETVLGAGDSETEQNEKLGDPSKQIEFNVGEKTQFLDTSKGNVLNFLQRGSRMNQVAEICTNQVLTVLMDTGDYVI